MYDVLIRKLPLTLRVLQAEDFEKAQAAAEAASVGVDKWSKTKSVSKKKAISSGESGDPLALIKEQLSQQDIKFEQMSGEHT